MKRFPWFEIALTMAVMSMSLYAALSDAQNLSLRWFTRDDAYYYFKVAQNISEGRGSTFDGINPTNGYHPLWMLVCIPIFALARFDLILPLRILLMVMSGLSAATGILLYRVVGRMFAPAIGALAGIYWVFSRDIFISLYLQGLESGIAAFFIVLLSYKLFEFEQSWRKNEAANKQLATLGVIAALMVFSRLDLVFVAGIAGIWIVFRGNPLRYLLPLDIVSVAISILLAFLVRLDLPEYYRYSDAAIMMIGLGLPVKILCAFCFGLYQHPSEFGARILFRRLALFSLTGSVATGGIMMLLMQIGILEGFPRTVFPLDLLFTFILFGLIRFALISWRTNRNEMRPEDKPFAALREHWKKWLMDGLAYYGVAFGALSAYMIWSRLSFGTFSPVSGQIKRWWGSFPTRVYGGSAREPLSFFGINYSGEGNSWRPVSKVLGAWARNLTWPGTEAEFRYLILLLLCAIIIHLLLRFSRQDGKTAIAQLSIIPLLAGSILQVLYYHAGGYSSYKEWYWVSQKVVTVLFIALLIGLLFRLTRALPYRHIAAWVLALTLGYNMGATQWAAIKITMQYGRWSPETPFMDIVPLLEKNTGPGSLIGMTGGGNVGYFIHDRTILNMDGLINSYQYFRALQNGQAGAYLNTIGLDYVLANPGILDHQPYKGQFNQYLELVNVHYGGKKLMRYHAP